jgi:hypothetical protein
MAPLEIPKISDLEGREEPEDRKVVEGMALWFDSQADFLLYVQHNGYRVSGPRVYFTSNLDLDLLIGCFVNDVITGKVALAFTPIGLE